MLSAIGTLDLEVHRGEETYVGILRKTCGNCNDASNDLIAYNTQPPILDSKGQ